MDLPEESNMQKAAVGSKPKQAKYEETTDEEFFNIDLGMESNFVGKGSGRTANSSTSSSPQSQTTAEETIPVKKTPMNRYKRGKASKKQQANTKKAEIDLDG